MHVAPTLRKTLISCHIPAEVENLKAEGNAATKKKNFGTALEKYVKVHKAWL